MDESIQAEEITEQAECANEGALGSKGIVEAIGALPPGAFISEEALAKMFCRHSVSVKRAVKRGELPPPTRLLGKPVWTAGSIVAHVEERLRVAKVEAEKDEARIARLGP